MTTHPDMPSSETMTLRPCPFCNGNAQIIEQEDSDGKFAAVVCFMCGAGSRQHYFCGDDARDHVASAWNKRAAHLESEEKEDWRIGMFERWRAAAQEKGYADIAEAIESLPEARGRECETCGGSGRERHHVGTFGGSLLEPPEDYFEEDVCSACDGTGYTSPQHGAVVNDEMCRTFLTALGVNPKHNGDIIALGMPEVRKALKTILKSKYR